MLNTLSGEMLCVKCHFLHDKHLISSSHCKPPPLLCPAHSPGKLCCCGREMDGCDELIYYSGLSVSEEGQQDDSAGRERKGCGY